MTCVLLTQAYAFKGRAYWQLEKRVNKEGVALG